VLTTRSIAALADRATQTDSGCKGHDHLFDQPIVYFNGSRSMQGQLTMPSPAAALLISKL
jgi:hypothetical protein